jgi:hypothetical protein
MSGAVSFLSLYAFMACKETVLPFSFKNHEGKRWVRCFAGIMLDFSLLKYYFREYVIFCARFFYVISLVKP